MHNPWDPYIQEQKALARALGRADAIQAFRDVIVEIVQNRFPSLKELAQKRVAQMENLDDLKELSIQIAVTFEKKAVKRILKEAVGM